MKESLPLKFVSILIPFKEVTENSVSLWFQRRSDENPELDGKLEFPGGKVEKEETPFQAVIREAQEELEISKEECGKPLFIKLSSFSYSDRKVVLYSYMSYGPELVKNAPGEWITFKNNEWRSKYEKSLPEANLEIIDDLMSFLTSCAKDHPELDTEKLWKQLDQLPNSFFSH
ncbi:MAG: NUDIX domain-containing protein [Bacteriovoracaceae bacterium]